jgi:hypothetical protein
MAPHFEIDGKELFGTHHIDDNSLEQLPPCVEEAGLITLELCHQIAALKA